MNFLNIQPDFQLAAIFVLGVLVGGLLNLGIYRLAWQPRMISPWSARPDSVPRRAWRDRIPVTGWFRLRRESQFHGRGFWIRPMMIEVGTGFLFAGLYWWEVVEGGLLIELAQPLVPGLPPAPVFQSALHATFFSHCILVSLMIVASFIDVDEKIIPDTITVPGTWLGLLLATIYPWSLLPDAVWLVPDGQPQLHFLTFASPNAWPRAFDGFPHVLSLLVAVFCWSLWCFALMPRRWYGRYGIARSTRYFLARLTREPVTWLLLLQCVIGAVAIHVAWWGASPANWAGLFTALIGMTVSGGLVWSFRWLASFVLGREAIGFGDVTLMAMIGTFVGWQPGVAIFFVAPFFALLHWILLRTREIYFGPFLCLATLLFLVRWKYIWQELHPLFGVGWFVPTLLGLSLVALVVLLFLLRGLRLLVKLLIERLF